MSTKEFDLLVFIGRFQPFHLEHKRIIDIALEKSKHVLVLIGSAGKPRTIRNSWTFAERKIMIQQNYPSPIFGEGSSWEAVPENHATRLIIRPLFDKTYNDTAWIRQVQDIVNGVSLDIANPGLAGKIFKPSGMGHLKIGLIGADKDHSSFYLKMFPQWGSVNVDILAELHATEIRNSFLDGTLTVDVAKNSLPTNVVDFLFRKNSVYLGHDFGFKDTLYYTQLSSELTFVRNYKKAWEAAPYPVKHVTVDALVEQSGHVLLVRRKAEPGKGLWALPGGHLNEFERLEDGMIRELREETKIKVPDPVLRGSIVANRTFDDPYRSMIGRVITQAYHIKLRDDVILPKVKGSDDADKARWVPISALHEEEFFDDHYAIINVFLGL